MRRRHRRPPGKIQCNHTIPYLTLPYLILPVVFTTFRLLTVPGTFCFGVISSVT
nr:MAG TPA: hypothetical protein [Caudoviricetes sp.]